MNQVTHFIQPIFCFAVFLVISLEIAGTTFQVCNFDGGITRWINKVCNPTRALLVLLGFYSLLMSTTYSAPYEKVLQQRTK